MGLCNSFNRNESKICIGKNKSFTISKETLKNGKNTYYILFCLDEQIPNSTISEANDLSQKGSSKIKLIKKMGQSTISNSLSSISKSIQSAFNKANEQGYNKIFIEEPRDLISKDINFILQQLIRMLLSFDLKRSHPKIKCIYVDWQGVQINSMIKRVQKDLSMI